MAATNSTNLIAVAQLTSKTDKYENFLIVEKLVKSATEQHAKMVFLPEYCDYVGTSPTETKKLAGSINGDLITLYSDLAKKYNVWLSLGGLHIEDPEYFKICKTHLVINNIGQIVGKYVKSHLYDVCHPKENRNLVESTFSEFGKSFSPPVNTPCGRLSLGICNDLRFAEMSILQRRAGADILSFPGSFNVPTGEAHWHALLRARAIETQCYVIAAAQTGKHSGRRSSYGHSLIVDPWGKIIAEIENEVGLAMATIDLNYLEKIRKKMPVINQRRGSLYSLFSTSRDDYAWGLELLPNPSDYCQHQFGHVFVPGSCILLKTFSSFVCVNKKPFSSNHLLVICDRPVLHLKDLSLSEVCDFAQTLLLTFNLLNFVKSPADIQIAIQDGVLSGQTIKHLHAHLVPCYTNQYILKQGHENSNKKWREKSDMVTETNMMRAVGTVIFKEKLNDILLQLPQPIQFMKASCDGIYKVKNINVKERNILFCSDLFKIMVAPEPILDGHILLSFKTNTNKLVTELTAKEISELFQFLQIVEKQLMACFKTSSVTIFSKINHKSNISNMLFHIIPRKEGDIKENDQIYTMIMDYENHLVQNPFIDPVQPDWTKNITFPATKLTN